MFRMYKIDEVLWKIRHERLRMGMHHIRFEYILAVLDTLAVLGKEIVPDKRFGQ